MEGNKFKFSLKGFLVFGIGTALALGSLKSEDPWVVTPMLCLAGLAFIALCVRHEGKPIVRVLVGLVIVALLVFIGWRDLGKPNEAKVIVRQSTVQSAVPSATTPQTQAKQPPAASKPSAKGSRGKSELGAKQSQQNRGSHNTNTQIGTAQAPVAIAPNGIANAAPNFGNQSVNNYAPLQRSLTQDQRNTLIAVLRKTCPFEVAVRAVPGNPESMSFGDELAKAITDAGCTLRRPRFLIDTSAGYGVWVMLHDRENIPSGANALVDALAQAGLTPKTNTLDAIEPGVVYLMVEFDDAK